MQLNDTIIAQTIKQKGLLSNAEDPQPISVDLHIDCVLFWKAKGTEQNGIDFSDIIVTYQTPYALKPHETVFVKAKESLDMPIDLVGYIVEKNSVMRLGLQVSGPMYQPTHKTAIFLRVTNLTEYTITLSKDFSIAQICFEEVYPPDKPYSKRRDAKYMGEFSFKVPDSLISEAIDPNEQIANEIKTVENKILTTFTIFMGAFVSSLALIVVNFNSYNKISNPNDIIRINFLLAVCIGVLLLSVFLFCFFINKKKTRQKIRKMNKRKQQLQEPTAEESFADFFACAKPRIYLAAKYEEHERNIQLYQKLTKAGLNVFLPENLGLEESEDDVKKKIVFHRCYKELRMSDIVVVVCPYGHSVSAEIGCAIDCNKLIICYNPDKIKMKSECMIDPGFTYKVESEDSLVNLLLKLV